LASLDKAIELIPDAAHAWFHRGEILIALGRYDEALTSLNKSIVLDSKNALA